MSETGVAIPLPLTSNEDDEATMLMTGEVVPPQTLEGILARESKILEQLEELQRKLDSEQRRTGSVGHRRLRSRAGVAEVLNRDWVGHGDGLDGRQQAQNPQNEPFTKRIVSVSFRLPKSDPVPGTSAEVFTSGVPPKGMFSLERWTGLPEVWIGCDWNGKRSADGSLYGGRAEYEWRRRQHSRSSDRGMHVPVTVPDELLSDFTSFCEQTLWSLLHYDYSGLSIGDDQAQKWDAYVQVNTRFAEAVTEVFEDGDLIWIHDYHLMLLPAMVRKRLWYARVGFFLYTPFPSSEIFRIIPTRAELLNGLLGADLIGFHRYDYSKQFVASCLRLIGVEGSPTRIELEPRDGHVCEIGIYPGGIDLQSLAAKIESPAVKSRVKELRKRYAGRRVIVGVDRMDDSFAGITHKLLAFEDFLARRPSMRESVVLVEVASNPRQREDFMGSVDKYAAQKKLVHEFVGRINAINGSPASAPVHFITSEITKEDLYAIMCVGEVCIVSSVRSGMNLIPYEWTVCQHHANNGPLILSEFAGSAQSFSTAIHVNPWDTEEVSSAIDTALAMSPKEREENAKIAYQFVSTHTARSWAVNFLEDLEVTEPVRARPAPCPLPDVSLIVESFRESTKRKLFFLSYDGTLVSYQPLAKLAAPPDNVVFPLKQLAKDPNVLVFVVTSRDRQTASAWFDEVGIGNQIGLVSEHGCYLRWPGQNEWDVLYEDFAGGPITDSWKAAVVPVMTHFSERTPGAVLEEGEATATWHYHDADLDFGKWQARDLHKHLESFIVQHLRVEVISGDAQSRWIKVRPIGASKALALEEILRRCASDIDFLFTAGEDRLDEEVFTILNDITRLSNFHFSGKVFTCHVGDGPSSAAYIVESPFAFVDILNEIVYNTHHRKASPGRPQPQV